MSAPPRTETPLRALARRILWMAELVVNGGRLRAAVLLRLLHAYFDGKFRREWGWADEPPHFSDHRYGAFKFAFGDADRVTGPFPWARGFFGAEVLAPGDVLLDIGCGDGFFSRRFFSRVCAHVDGIDIEPSAIATARRENPAPNVTYHLLDATRGPFPRERYDVVVWDGAIGHFPAEACDALLRKIAGALAPGGVFVGSESLGHEGHDHLQFFEGIDDLGALLRRHFAHVRMRSLEYPIGGGAVRREAYWRCSDAPGRLDRAGWVAGR